MFHSHGLSALLGQTGDNPYTLLFAGEYAINYKGEYFLIDKEEAIKMCESIISNTKVYSTVNNITNNRYLSLIDGKWDIKYMNKSTMTDAPLKNVQMIGNNNELLAETEMIKLSIKNTSSNEIELGSRLELEVIINGIWYLTT
ncbi:hypothetical protein [Anaerocolumna sp.]|uniref:hypothetical protein n=1 Tax=Anaerocolumna sp. TaxID=2041569 RepID=UPI0028A90C6F|nr:hypothetical protein [Anaerocolumna sp.]